MWSVTVGCLGPSTSRPDAPNTGAEEKIGPLRSGGRKKAKPIGRGGEQPREHRLKPMLPGGGEEYNCGYGQQTNCADIAGYGFAFAD